MQKKICVDYQTMVTKSKDIVVTEEAPILTWIVHEKRCCICEWSFNEGHGKTGDYVMAMKGNDGVYFRHMDCDVGK